MTEGPKRSLAKTLTWRALATSTTITIVYLMTGQLALSITAGGIEVVAKMILYFLHERAWNKITWGHK